MKKIYFTPGPTELYPTTISHFKKGFSEHIGSISHRSKEFQEIYRNIFVVQARRSVTTDRPCAIGRLRRKRLMETTAPQLIEDGTTGITSQSGTLWG